MIELKEKMWNIDALIWAVSNEQSYFLIEALIFIESVNEHKTNGGNSTPL